MKNFDKIITLLEKNKLTTEEKNLLDKLLKDDAEANEFYNSYKKLGAALLASRHLTIDELADYVLMKNELEPEKKESKKNIPLFEVHIRRCEKCAKEIENLNKEYSDVDSFVSARFTNHEEPKSQISSSKIISFTKFNFYRYAIIGISVIAVLFFLVMVISNLSTSKYYKLASIGDSSDISVSRGRTTNDFELSIKALEEKNYQRAIEHLKSDIELNKNEETIFYSYYILGLTNLETAEENLFGLFPKFNKSSAEAALQNFKKTIELNTSGKFQNVNLDAYFYAAKACLMLEDSKSAKEYLNIVVKEKGSKMNEAARILNELK
jgi:tetratricopeptide (TPR) repeat protein